MTGVKEGFSCPSLFPRSPRHPVIPSSRRPVTPSPASCSPFHKRLLVESSPIRIRLPAQRLPRAGWAARRSRGRQVGPGGGRGGRGVASQWRIRHKLILGLGLVVVIMALQLAGTLKGLMSYRATLSAVGVKWVELDMAYKLRDAGKLLP